MDSQTPNDKEVEDLSKMKFRMGRPYQLVPNGEYEVILVECEISTKNYKRKTLKLEYELTSGEHKGARATDFVNVEYKAFSEFCKLNQHAKLILGERLEEGELVTLDIYRDKLLLVRIEQRPSRKTGILFNRVVEILGVIREL